MRGNKLLATALLLAGLGSAGVAGRLTARSPEPGAVEHHPGHWVVTGPSCPTEDSCAANFGEQPDGSAGWSIMETPGDVECDDFEVAGQTRCVHGDTGQVME